MKEMFGSDFVELVALFQEDTPKRINALHLAAGNGNQGEMIRVAHALSGSASSMGASSLALLCKTLENELKSGALENLPSRVKAIETDYLKIRAKLQSMIEPI